MYSCLMAGVAQLVEHLICNQVVGGSTPSAGTITTPGSSVATAFVSRGRRGQDARR